MALRVAVAQIRTRKADYPENLRKVGATLADISRWERPPGLMVFPETVMTGYFVEAGVRECAVTAGTLCSDLAAMHAAVGAPALDVVVGFYEEFRNRYFVSAVYVTLTGGDPVVRHVHRKLFLPTYGVFDEKRFVGHGRSLRSFEAEWGRGAILICEDAFHSISASLAALDGAQVIFVPSSAPARGIGPSPSGAKHAGPRPGSVAAWDLVIRRLANENGVYLVLAQPVGFEGGKALQGGSTIVAPDGEIMVTAPSFEEALIVADLDLDLLTRVRADEPLLADLEYRLPVLLQAAEAETEPLEFDGPRVTVDVADRPEPAGHGIVEVPDAPDPLAIDCDLAERWLVAFLEDEILRRRDFQTAVVGLSGGVDSSVAAILAARALGPENVIGVRMPYKTSSQDSLDHAQLVAERFGLRMETINITGAVDGYLASAGDTGDDTRKGNAMARLRMITLFDLSAKYAALPVGTGNKTERLFGYFTWHGDDAPPINPLGDLYKTQVTELARHVGVPGEILAKPPTADLVRGQTDESDLGISYGDADRILHWLLTGLRPEQIVERGFDPADVELVRSRLDGTHWKRRLPTVAMLSHTAIGESYLRPVDY